MAADVEKMEVSDNLGLSTAEWLVDRAKQSLKQNNVFEAKSWLLTAKTLFPKDFHVQHEAYNIERNTKRVKESANLFYEMFVQFPSENLLLKDIQNLTVALEENGNLDQTSEFLKEMFNCLPQSAQREILLQAAGRCKDCIEKCRMMLLLMRRFPDSIPKNGITLTDMLCDVESTEYPNNPLNPYRKLLVCDVLPHLLTSESIEIEGVWSSEGHESHRPTLISLQTALKWLELSIQFYAFCATYVPGPNISEAQMMSPSSHANESVNEAREIVSSVQEGKGPWFELFQIFCQIAKKSRWSEILKIQDKLDPLLHRNIKERWTCISEVHHFLKKAAKHGTSGRDINEAQEKTGVFYATIIIFIQSVWEYCKVVNKVDVAGNPNLSQSTSLVLIEDMGADRVGNEGWAGDTPSETSSSAPKKKKKKGSTAPLSPSREEQRAKQSATIVVSKNCGTISSSISEDFVVSVDTWHILNTHVDYKNEFTRVLTEWHTDLWIWMETFKVDRMVYKAKYKKVVDFLKVQKSFLISDPNPINQEHSCTEALDALLMFSKINSSSDGKTLKRGISTIQSSTSRDIATLFQGSSQGLFQFGTDCQTTYTPGRSLQLIPSTEMEALTFCVRLLITCFKQKISYEGRGSGDLVGHMVVLLQCDWPKEERTFYELLDRIRSHGGLTYRKFFDYVVNIDILEEFSYLNSEGVLKLELLPKAPSTSRSRTVTRGVNKGAKEDFRSAMEKQVSRCEENIESILKTFLEEERDSIAKIL